MYTKINGAFKKASKVLIKVNNTWKEGKEVWTKVGGVWRKDKDISSETSIAAGDTISSNIQAVTGCQMSSTAQTITFSPATQVATPFVLIAGRIQYTGSPVAFKFYTVLFYDTDGSLAGVAYPTAQRDGSWYVGSPVPSVSFNLSKYSHCYFGTWVQNHWTYDSVGTIQLTTTILTTATTNLYGGSGYLYTPRIQMWIK